MSIPEILAALEASQLSGRIRDSLYLFPLIESFHVLGLTMVFGTIAIVDLRLLGLASTRRPFSRVALDVLNWTWLSFALTVATGVLMFITNAGVYYHNLSFRLKMGMLVLSGINMLIFKQTAARSIGHWDREPAAPAAGRIVATVSLIVWIGVIFLGRWIGFTSTRAQPAGDSGISIDIESLLPK